MKKRNIKELVIINIILLIPLILYGLFKNGYLLYTKNLVSIGEYFKPLYLTLISIGIKVIFDLIINHKILINYNLLYMILISMIMPYNINLIVYAITLSITYFLSTILESKIKFNKVCFIYLVIILVNSLFQGLTFLSPLESKYSFSFSFIDLLLGRNIGGISSTSIFFSLLAYTLLINSYYYKKDIPLTINITYLILAFITYLITKDNSILLNSEIIFGSIFVATLPKYSPYRKSKQILSSILIGLLTFALSFLNPTLSIYLAIFIISLLPNVELLKKKTSK